MRLSITFEEIGYEAEAQFHWNSDHRKDIAVLDFHLISVAQTKHDVLDEFDRDIDMIIGRLNAAKQEMRKL